MIYTATITNASLRVRECRIVAGLLLDGVDNSVWKSALYDKNVLQMTSPVSIRKVSNLLRLRIEPLGAGLWAMINDGDKQLATQAAFAGAVRQSRLLGDFLDITMREQLKVFSKNLEPRLWNSYIADCRGRDPDMPHWSELTLKKLRSVVLSMVAEAGYFKSSRDLEFQNVFLNPQLAGYLQDRREHYVLRCLRVNE